MIATDVGNVAAGAPRSRIVAKKSTSTSRVNLRKGRFKETANSSIMLSVDYDSDMPALKALSEWLVCHGSTLFKEVSMHKDADEASAFLEKLYSLDSCDPDVALDEIILRFDAWLERGDWRVCRRILLQADARKLSPQAPLAILSMTAVEKDKLGKARQALCARTRKKITDAHNAVGAEENLAGLE